MQATVYVAIDTPDLKAARELVSEVSMEGIGLKIGLEFFVANGSSGVRDLMAGACAPLFLDLKFHDIPNTVAGAVRAAVALEPAVINVHAGGGAAMMRAAVAAVSEAAKSVGVRRPLVLAVTVLTSMDESDLIAVGQQGPPHDQVVRLATLAQECGMDGVVCSAREIELIRKNCGRDFVLIVPGIRPAGSSQGDQKRVMTPSEAMRAGATALVVGRPITSATHKREAALAVLRECEAALPTVPAPEPAPVV